MKIGKNPPFLVKCTPFSQMKFFPNILAIYIGQEHDLCFFEKFDPLYAIVMAYKWLTFEKSVPHPSKTIKNFKKLEMVRCLKFNFVLFRKFWSNLETLFVEKEKNYTYRPPRGGLKRPGFPADNLPVARVECVDLCAFHFRIQGKGIICQ